MPVGVERAGPGLVVAPGQAQPDAPLRPTARGEPDVAAAARRTPEATAAPQELAARVLRPHALRDRHLHFGDRAVAAAVGRGAEEPVRPSVAETRLVARVARVRRPRVLARRPPDGNNALVLLAEHGAAAA